MSREIVEAVRAVERERGLEEETLLTAVEEGLLAAYKKSPDSARHATVELDDDGEYRVYALELESELEERLLEEARERELERLEAREEEARANGERLQPTLIRDEELELAWDQVPEGAINRRDVTPAGFGRIAAQTARQVIQQRLRDAERLLAYEEYKDRVGELATGIVRQADARSVLVDLGRVEAVLPRSEQIPGERYEQGSRLRALITEIRLEGSGPLMVLSRRDPWIVAELFALEVPEVADGLVEIKNVAREPGFRSKILVQSHAPGVDPVGACVGPRGARVRPVVSELRGEKIDIIPWAEDPARGIARALQPARVSEVYLDEDAKEATAIVPEGERALAIGKEGLNVRLAARLLGWRIDVKSASEFADSDLARETEAEDQAHRCQAILSSGKRCPNAALANSDYCGLPAHQALQGRALAAADPVEVLSEDEARNEESGEVSAEAVAATLDAIPGASARVQAGREDAVAGRVTPLDDLAAPAEPAEESAPE